MKKTLGSIFLPVMMLLFFHFTAHAFKLPDTGVTKCYDSQGNVLMDCYGTGQDGAYNINPMSYTSNGTVTEDLNTGLVWQYSDENNDNNGYNWYQASGTVNTKYNPAGPNFRDVCGELNASKPGGYDEWRLPTKKELMSLVDYSIGPPGPAIDTNFFDYTPMPTSHWPYWSSTVYAGDSLVRLGVDYGEGTIIGSSVTNHMLVRCVRGGRLSQLLSWNEDYTVTDNRTGLVWQRCSAGQNNDSTCSGTAVEYGWSAAIDYCLNLSLGNPTGGWRLPNIKEIESLIDDTRVYPAINTTFFPNTQPPYWYRTSDYYPFYVYPRVWYMDFGSGQILYAQDQTAYVRCVRGDGVNTCLGIPIMLDTLPYQTIVDAYTDADEGETIQMQAMQLVENIYFNRDISVTLSGGYNCGFTSNNGFTTILGKVNISQGNVTIQNIVIPYNVMTIYGGTVTAQNLVIQ